MTKNDIKKIIMSIRTSENEHQINYILGKIDLLSEEEIQLMLTKIGNDEKSIICYLKEKLNKQFSGNRRNKTFSQIKITLEKVLELLARNNLTLYISGGIVPYVLLNQDSNRLHDDIDTICKLEDIKKLRELFIAEGLYDPSWDSKTYSKDGRDYGFEMIIEGVPFGIYPFEYKDGIITQYSFDPYNKKCKIKTFPLVQITDYIYSYKSKDGRMYNTMRLEYIKLTKDNTDHAQRPQDAIDSIKISEYGISKDVMSRVSMYEEVENERSE